MRINHKTNPAIAYKMGYEAGLKESGTQGFMASNIMQLLAYYNVIDDFIKTEKTQVALAQAIEVEMNRLFVDEFTGDIDNIARAIEGVNTIRSKYKMTPIEWDWSVPQAATGTKGDAYREYLSKERK
jgi:hypothetical protein